MDKQTSEPQMPILGDKIDVKSVPFSFLDRERAMSVHDQTLERLAERGGMAVIEILHNRGMLDMWEEKYKTSSVHYSLLKFMLAFDTRGKIISNERIAHQEEIASLRQEVERLTEMVMSSEITIERERSLANENYLHDMGELGKKLEDSQLEVERLKAEVDTLIKECSEDAEQLSNVRSINKELSEDNQYLNSVIAASESLNAELVEALKGVKLYCDEHGAFDPIVGHVFYARLLAALSRAEGKTKL